MTNFYDKNAFMCAQLCPTLCGPMDCSLPDFSVRGIFPVIILEWVAIPPPGDLIDPGVEPVSPALAGMFFTWESDDKNGKTVRI